MTPIVCVGETLGEREAGATETVVLRQLDAVIAAVGQQLAALVVAYEPVWAIGTGRTASPEQAQDVHRLLRTRLSAADKGAADVLLLYGGSVKPGNEDMAMLWARPIPVSSIPPDHTGMERCRQSS